MPRSTTANEGMKKRNEDRVRRLVRTAIGEETDRLISELLHWRRASKGMPADLVSGEAKYLEDMISALRRLKARFPLNTVKHVPQENRGDGSEN